MRTTRLVYNGSGKAAVVDVRRQKVQMSALEFTTRGCTKEREEQGTKATAKGANGRRPDRTTESGGGAKAGEKTKHVRAPPPMIAIRKHA
jgi:hypothetical protein